MSNWSIDGAALALFVHATRTIKLDLSVREAGKAAGVPHSAIHRAERRQTLSAANFLALCAWLDLNPFALLIRPDGGRLAPLPAALVQPVTAKRRSRA